MSNAIQFSDQAPKPACTVFYDGGCPVCSAEIAHYQRQREASGFVWADASSCDEAVLGPGVDLATVLRRFHVRHVFGGDAKADSLFRPEATCAS